MQGKQIKCKICGRPAGTAEPHINISTEKHTRDGLESSDHFRVHPECWDEVTDSWVLSD